MRRQVPMRMDGTTPGAQQFVQLRAADAEDVGGLAWGEQQFLHGDSLLCGVGWVVHRDGVLSMGLPLARARATERLGRVWVSPCPAARGAVAELRARSGSAMSGAAERVAVFGTAVAVAVGGDAVTAASSSRVARGSVGGLSERAQPGWWSAAVLPGDGVDAAGHERLELVDGVDLVSGRAAGLSGGTMIPPISLRPTSLRPSGCGRARLVTR